jgi:uncharacterized RDD family membrane protein YckC
LSIFEVDPALPDPQAAAASAPAGPAAFDWSAIELGALPLDEYESAQQRAQDAAEPELEMAPMGRRLMAAIVDGALIAGACLAAAVVAATRIDQLPALRIIEAGSAVALVAIAGLYQTIFLVLAEATPGMKYARIGLSTFENEFPTLAQRCGRLGALLLSVLPLGLGLVWAIFDENHLSWHDRLSRTYPRLRLV